MVWDSGEVDGTSRYVLVIGSLQIDVAEDVGVGNAAVEAQVETPNGRR